MNRDDLQKLSDTRAREAQVLLNAGEYSGAYYLAGYAVECALKACFARLTQQYDFPDKQDVNKVHTHSLDALVPLAKLTVQLKTENEADPLFSEHWQNTKNWSEVSRYREYSQEDAEELLLAISDNEHGVLSWVRRFW